MSELVWDEHTREFYSNFRISENDGWTIESWVYGRKIVVTYELLCNILEVELNGVYFTSDYLADLGFRNDAQLLNQVYQPHIFNNKAKIGKNLPSASNLLFDNKIAHFLLVKVIRPISGSYNHVLIEHCFYLYLIMTRQKVDLARLVIQKMQSYIPGKQANLTYGSLISLILNRFTIKMTGLDYASRQLGATTLKLMDIKVGKGDILFWQGIQVSMSNFALMEPNAMNYDKQNPTTNPTPDASSTREPPPPSPSDRPSCPSHRSSRPSSENRSESCPGMMRAMLNMFLCLREDVRKCCRETITLRREREEDILSPPSFEQGRLNDLAIRRRYLDDEDDDTSSPAV